MMFSGRVLEPGGDERAAAAGDAPLVLVHPVVALELDAAFGQLADRGLDVVHLKHQDGVTGRGAVRFGVHPDVVAAGQAQGEQPVLPGFPGPRCLAVERPGLARSSTANAPNAFVSANMACSFPLNLFLRRLLQRAQACGPELVGARAIAGVGGNLDDFPADVLGG